MATLFTVLSVVIIKCVFESGRKTKIIKGKTILNYEVIIMNIYLYHNFDSNRHYLAMKYLNTCATKVFSHLFEQLSY